MKKTIFLLFSFYLSINLMGQEVVKQLDLRTPHDAIWVHLFYLQPDQYHPELSALAFLEGDSLSRVRQAIKLKQILDGKGLYVHMNMLPQEVDYLDTVSQKHFYTPFPDQLPEIYLEKVNAKWYYAKSTSNAIPALHKKVYPLGTDIFLKYFSNQGQKRFLGISGWQFFGIFCLIILSGFLYIILSGIFRWLSKKLAGAKLKHVLNYDILNKKVTRVFTLLVVFWLIKLLVPLLQLPIKWASSIHLGLQIIITVFLMMFFLRLVTLLIAYMTLATEQTENKMDDQVMPIFDRLLKMLVVLAAVIQILRLLDVNVTALIAGVSIGGLALALAAQDTVKNLIGSVMIFTDRPFQIGDWVEGSGYAGSVVEVGFRSTRIKTPDTSIIAVPNGSMANASVVNKGVREFRLYNTTLGITYDTPPDYIEAFMDGIKKIIIEHPIISNEGYYVNFVELGASSLNIMVRAYIKTNAYDEELNIREELHLSIMRWAETLGIRFAFPSTTMFIEEIPGQMSLTPTFKHNPESIQKKWEDFHQDFVNRINKETNHDEAT
jgi:MscS family membrane protein